MESGILFVSSATIEANFVVVQKDNFPFVCCFYAAQWERTRSLQPIQHTKKKAKKFDHRGLTNKKHHLFSENCSGRIKLSILCAFLVPFPVTSALWLSRRIFYSVTSFAQWVKVRQKSYKNSTKNELFSNWLFLLLDSSQFLWSFCRITGCV